MGRSFPDERIPVEREGNDMSALREVIKKIREGNGVVLFPEGTRSKDGNLTTGAGWHRARHLQDAGSGHADAHLRRIPGISQRLTRPESDEDTVVIGEPLRFSRRSYSCHRETYQRIGNRVMKQSLRSRWRVRHLLR